MAGAGVRGSSTSSSLESSNRLRNPDDKTPASSSSSLESANRLDLLFCFVFFFPLRPKLGIRRLVGLAGVGEGSRSVVRRCIPVVLAGGEAVLAGEAERNENRFVGRAASS